MHNNHVTGNCPVPYGRAARLTNQLIKEKIMSQNNTVTLSGKVKNITARGNTGSIVTANLTQRGDDGKCITTMPLVWVGNGDSVLGLEPETNVEIIGRLVTRFDRRPGIDNSLRAKPFTQIEVTQVTVK
jgi:hypothetical protein